MKIHLNLSFKLGLAIGWQLVAQPAFAAPREQAELAVHGYVYENACLTGALQKLRATLAAADPQAAPVAWNVIRTLLCDAPGAEAGRRLDRIMPAAGISLCEGVTGEPGTARCVRVARPVVADVLASGKAWGARITATPGQIDLHYLASEYCVGERKLRHAAGRWRLESASLNCD